MDTGGGLGTLLREVVVEEPEKPEASPAAPAKPSPPTADLGLRDLMAQDPIFRRLTEQGLADLDAGRIGPL
jgi:hypothetical protein